MMKRLSIFFIFIIIFLSNNPLCQAEKVFYKDGSVKRIRVLHRKQEIGQINNPGIDLEDIERIENDDGTISKFDFKTLCSAIQENLKQQKYEQALDLCNLLAEMYPENSKIYFLRGSLNQKIGNFGKAIQDYEFLIKSNLADATVFNNMGVIYAQEKEYKTASELFYRAIKDNPLMAEAHDNLAELFMHTEDYNKAIIEYSKVLESDPENIKVLYNLGMAYMNSGSFLKAEEQWEKILVIDFEDKDAWDALEYIRKKSSEDARGDRGMKNN